MHKHQKNILIKLSKLGQARFNQLKDTNLDPKQFTYHLQQLIKQNLIQKKDNIYILTNKAKVLLGMYLHPYYNFFQPGLATLLYVENKNKEILVVKRSRSPFLNFIGNPTTRVKVNELAQESANRLAEDLGIKQDPKLVAILDYLYQAEEIDEIYRHVLFVFYVEVDKVAESEIEEGHLLWISQKELLQVERGYDNTQDIVKAVEKFRKSGGIQFISKRYKTTL